MFGKKRMLLTINHDNAMWRPFFYCLDRRTKENIKISTFVAQGGVVSLFAYLHDKWRVDNEEDLEHGKRAAENLPALRSSPMHALQVHSSMHSAISM